MRDHSLSKETILEHGGWNQQFARVLLVEEHSDQAIALVDGNGDGSELELEFWSRDSANRWVCGSSSGHMGLDSLKVADTWSIGTHVVALGKAEPGSEIRLSYSGNTYSRQANEFGIWGFISPVGPGPANELPVLH